MSNNILLVNDLDINLAYPAAEGDPAHPVPFLLKKVMGKTMGTKTQRAKTRSQIIGASIEVHQTLGGPELLESIYESHPLDFFVP